MYNVYVPLFLSFSAAAVIRCWPRQHTFLTDVFLFLFVGSMPAVHSCILCHICVRSLNKCFVCYDPRVAEAIRTVLYITHIYLRLFMYMPVRLCISSVSPCDAIPSSIDHVIFFVSAPFQYIQNGASSSQRFCFYAMCVYVLFFCYLVSSFFHLSYRGCLLQSAAEE